MAHGHTVDIDVSPTPVKVSYDGTTLAETERAVVLLETGLPPRYYIPREDVRTELLTKTEKRTDCPFKGTASYWSVRVGDQTVDDAVWSYETPIPAAEAIAGLLCFYNEKVDLDVDGERLERPVTPWS